MIEWLVRDPAVERQLPSEITMAGASAAEACGDNLGRQHFAIGELLRGKGVGGADDTAPANGFDGEYIISQPQRRRPIAWKTWKPMGASVLR